jgi:RimJ/RimL family protein N-acetyltransferase
MDSSLTPPQPDVRLRAVQTADLERLYEQQNDAAAAAMAAFPPRDYAQFMAHWHRILADTAVVTQAIVVGSEVAGNIGSWTQDERREVGYWLGREFWGRGIATRALALLLRVDPTRPLYATVAAHNVGSLRVLAKCGFVVVGEHVEQDADGPLTLVELRLDG